MQLLQARMSPSFCRTGEGCKNGRGWGGPGLGAEWLPTSSQPREGSDPYRRTEGPAECPAQLLSLAQGHRSLEGLEGDVARLG